MKKIKSLFHWLAWKLYGKRHFLARQKFLATAPPSLLMNRYMPKTVGAIVPLGPTITPADVIVHKCGGEQGFDNRHMPRAWAETNQQLASELGRKVFNDE